MGRNYVSEQWLRLILLLVCISSCLNLFAQQQQLKIKDFAIYGGFSKLYHDSNYVRIGANAKVNGGLAGSNDSMVLLSSATVDGSIYSGNTVNLASNTIITGNVTANNGSAT